LRRSRGIHAARPTPRHLHSACTQVAIGVVWDIAHLEARSEANAAFDFYAIPVGDAGGHDGTGRDSDEAVRHLADEPSDPPLRCCRTTSASPIGFGLQLEIWIRHVIAARQIGLWLTPDLFRLRRVTWKSTPSNQGCLLLVWPRLRRGSFTPATLRGPAPNGHPCPCGALAASMPLDPLRAARVQPAPKSRFVASGISRT
jgi:hypothetical protein